MIYPKDFAETIAELDTLLPTVPEPPKVEQENPPPYKLKRTTFGSLLGKKKEGGK